MPADAIPLSDGRTIPWGEVEAFFTHVVPREYPVLSQLRIDSTLPAAKKLIYMIHTLPDRLWDAKRRGKTVVGRWGAANPTDIFYACGMVPTSTYGFGTRCAFRGDISFIATGRAALAQDTCAWQACMHGAIKKGAIPMDVGYTFVGTWCYDSQYNFENLREHIPFVGYFDQAMFGLWPGKDAQVFRGYIRRQLEKFFDEMETVTGRRVTEEDLRREIRLENRIRASLRKLKDFELTAAEPPMDSMTSFMFDCMTVDWLADTTAALSILEGACAEVEERVQRGERAAGVKDEPVRVLMTGMPPFDYAFYNQVDDLGGVQLGLDGLWNTRHIREDGDPYDALVDSIVDIPVGNFMLRGNPDTLETVRKGRVDGVIFHIVVGCRRVAEMARLYADTLKEKTGIPTLIIEGDLPGQGHGQRMTRLQAFFETIG
ncbi:MAG: 2-hydroxyacyl-CoA dehydratase [Candidatus Rokubacteria bacterium]|nr:2-hydroxyacyl-CoA dehydratase [Candidatus Rokubacteria bacterium]